jgi:hypothetical protein
VGRLCVGRSCNGVIWLCTKSYTGIPEVYAVNMAVLSKLTTQRSAVLTSGAVAAFFLYKKYGGKRRTRYMSVSYIDFVEKSKFFQYCVAGINVHHQSSKSRIFCNRDSSSYYFLHFCSIIDGQSQEFRVKDAFFHICFLSQAVLLANRIILKKCTVKDMQKGGI